MTTETLVIALLVILIIGTLPTWPYSRSWGYNFSGLLVVILVVFGIWLAVGNRHTGDGDIERSFREAGQNIKQGARDAGESVQELGQDVKRSVQDAAD